MSEYGANEESLDCSLSQEVRRRVQTSKVIASGKKVVEPECCLPAQGLLSCLHGIDHLALVLLRHPHGLVLRHPST
jgi:hypothetical protein